METWRRAWMDALDEIKRCGSFAILSHVRPDGDAYGSTLALGLALEAAGKRVRMFNQDGQLERYKFLPGYDRVERTPEGPPENVEAVLAVDNASHARLGGRFMQWGRDVLVNIDHHKSNEGYGRFNVVNAESPATCEMLFDLFEAAGWSMSPEIADNLFVGLATDTGGFRFSNAGARSFEVAAALARAGARVAEMNLRCFRSFPLRRTKLLRAIFNRTQFEAGDRIAFYEITPAMYEMTGALPEDTEGLIDPLIGTEEVLVAMAFEERVDGTVKVSFRSKGSVDVNALAGEFGGGGHSEAAGATIAGSLATVREAVLAAAAARL